jgi:hypothetical protein
MPFLDGKAIMLTARAGLGADVIANLLYPVGGRNSTSVLAKNQRFTPQPR